MLETTSNFNNTTCLGVAFFLSLLSCYKNGACLRQIWVQNINEYQSSHVLIIVLICMLLYFKLIYSINIKNFTYNMLKNLFIIFYLIAIFIQKHSKVYLPCFGMFQNPIPPCFAFSCFLSAYKQLIQMQIKRKWKNSIAPHKVLKLLSKLQLHSTQKSSRKGNTFITSWVMSFHCPCFVYV